MDSKELAQRLNGREYTKEITKEEEGIAKASGLVVVFGYSDDCVEMRGAIDDELGAWDGLWIYLTKEGLFKSKCKCDCPYFEEQKASAVILKAIWGGSKGYSWTFVAPFPHETFEIIEDEEKFCRGIVFALADVAA